MSAPKILLLMLSVLALVFAQHPSAGQTPAPPPNSAATPATTPFASVADNSRTEAGRPFTREEKVQLAARVLAPPPAMQRTTPQRRKVISVTSPAATEALPPARGRRIARLVVFNYAEGKAASLLVDASSAEVLAQEPIRGRPQPSEEEKQDAIKIIRNDPELDRLLQANAIFEGGFIVDGPRGASPKHRFFQIQLLTPDRLHLQRTVTVDLTAGTIAISKAGG